jgi:succinate dehydrogenase hydrophobic anchor subunit
MRNARLWFLSIIAAWLIVILLSIHMALLHLNDILTFFGVNNLVEPTSWDSMIERARQGIWVFIYIALLVTTLYHALYGLRNIILERTPSAGIERVVTGIIIVVGVIFLVLGTYVPIALVSS